MVESGKRVTNIKIQTTLPICKLYSDEEKEKSQKMTYIMGRYIYIYWRQSV